jgi:crotonobetainyl-CoA:carnitine CoA-transferase CaiB-like acyl-CoA transferase
MTELPLEGVRILDLTGMLAGPYATRLLADMGAETIKVESLRRYDLTRGPVAGDARARIYPDEDPGDSPTDRSSYYNEMNRNKLGITLDLQTDRGREIFLRLVAESDVVIENFSAGVLERLGLAYETLCGTKADIIVVSMPAFGNSGPWRNGVAYGNTMEALSGFAAVNGYPDSLPITTSFTYGDPVAGVHAAFALLAAIEYRDRTGEGQFVDLSQLETLVQFIGESVLDYSMNARLPERTGGRDSSRAPDGVYRCHGDDNWVSISGMDDEGWLALSGLIGRGDLRDVSASERLERRDELDEAVEAWTSTLDRVDAMIALQSAGIAAAAVLDAPGIAADAQVAERGYLEEISHPQAGTHSYPGLPWRMSGIDRTIRMPAPTLGEHNGRVFGELLGMSEGELATLAEEGVAGTKP